MEAEIRPLDIKELNAEYMQSNKSHYAQAAMSWDHTATLVLTFLVTQASLMYTCYAIGHLDGLEAGGSFVTEFPYTLNGLHLWMTLSLVICTIGLFSRKVIGFFLSFIALVSIFVVYGLWHVRTVQYLSALQQGSEPYSRIHNEVGFFHGATRWDFGVLTIVAVLFMWHIFKLVKMMMPAQTEFDRTPDFGQ